MPTEIDAMMPPLHVPDANILQLLDRTRSSERSLSELAGWLIGEGWLAALLRHEPFLC